MINYSFYEDCPQATEYSRGRARGQLVLGFFLCLGTPTVLFWFSYIVRKCLLQFDLYDFICSVFFVLIIAVLNYYFFSWKVVTELKTRIILAKFKATFSAIDGNEIEKQLKKEIKSQKKETAKIYWPFVIWVVLLMTGLSVLSKAVYFICHRQPQVVLLVVAFVGTAITFIGVWVTSKQFKRLFVTRKMQIVHRNQGSRVVYQYCHKCGIKLMQNEEFCRNCGTSLVRTIYQEKDDEYYRQFIKGNAGSSLQEIAKFLCIFCMITFWAFALSTNPEVVLFLLEIVGALVLTVLFFDKAVKKSSKVFYIVSMIICGLVILAVIGLHILYESKVDWVLADVPGDKIIEVYVEVDEKKYIDSREVTTWVSTDVELGGEGIEFIRCETNDLFLVEVGEEYILKIKCEYGLLNKVEQQTTITFRPEDIGEPMIFVEEVELQPNEYQQVVVTFTRNCTFWEVIFY